MNLIKVKNYEKQLLPFLLAIKKNLWETVTAISARHKNKKLWETVTVISARHKIYFRK